MGIERRKHFAVQKLSQEGQDLVRRGIDENWTLERIQRDLEASTGETLALSSLHRWISEERIRRKLARQEQARELLLEGVKANPDGRAAKMVSLLLEEALIQKIDFSEKSSDDLLDELRAQQKIELEHKKIEIGQQIADSERIKAIAAEKRAEAALTQADAAMKRVDLMHKKLSEVGRDLETAEQNIKSGRGLKSEDLLQIREKVFGLVAQTEEADDGA